MTWSQNWHHVTKRWHHIHYAVWLLPLGVWIPNWYRQSSRLPLCMFIRPQQFRFSSKESTKFNVGGRHTLQTQEQQSPTDLLHWQPRFLVSAVYSSIKTAFLNKFIVSVYKVLVFLVAYWPEIGLGKLFSCFGLKCYSQNSQNFPYNS